MTTTKITIPFNIPIDKQSEIDKIKEFESVFNRNYQTQMRKEFLVNNIESKYYNFQEKYNNTDIYQTYFSDVELKKYQEKVNNRLNDSI